MRKRLIIGDESDLRECSRRDGGDNGDKRQRQFQASLLIHMESSKVHLPSIN